MRRSWGTPEKVPDHRPFRSDRGLPSAANPPSRTVSSERRSRQAVFAAGGSTISGVGSVAAQVTTNMSALAKLVTAASYVAGMAFAVGAIVKLKAHKDQPTQVPISAGIVLLFVGAALIFVPTVFKVGGATLFGQSGGQQATVKGISSF